MVLLTERTNNSSLPKSSSEVPDAAASAIDDISPNIFPDESKLESTENSTDLETEFDKVIWNFLLASHGPLDSETIRKILEDSLRIKIAVDFGSSASKFSFLFPGADGVDQGAWRHTEFSKIELSGKVARVINPDQFQQAIAWLQEQYDGARTIPQLNLRLPSELVVTSYQHSIAIETTTNQGEQIAFAILCDPTLSPTINEDTAAELLELGVSQGVIESLVSGERLWLSKMVAVMQHWQDFSKEYDIPADASVTFSTAPGLMIEKISNKKIGIPQNEKRPGNCTSQDLQLLGEYFEINCQPFLEEDLTAEGQSHGTDQELVRMEGDLVAEMKGISQLISYKKLGDIVSVSTDSVVKVIAPVNGKGITEGYKTKPGVEGWQYTTSRYGFGGATMLLKPIIIQAAEMLEIADLTELNVFNYIDRLCDSPEMVVALNDPKYQFIPLESEGYCLMDLNGTRHELHNLAKRIIDKGDKQELLNLIYSVLAGSVFTIREKVDQSSALIMGNGDGSILKPNQYPQIGLYGGLLPHSDKKDGRGEGTGLLELFTGCFPEGTKFIRLPFNTATEAALYVSADEEIKKNGAYQVKPHERLVGKYVNAFREWRDIRNSFVRTGLLEITANGGVEIVNRN